MLDDFAMHLPLGTIDRVPRAMILPVCDPPAFCASAICSRNLSFAQGSLLFPIDLEFQENPSIRVVESDSA